MAEKDPNLTQSRLAAESGVHKDVLSGLRRNTFVGVHRKTIDLLCAYFGCEVGDLFVMKEVEDE